MKYVPKSKPKHIEFGEDDCGEDLSSIAWVDTVECPYDHRQCPPMLLMKGLHHNHHRHTQCASALILARTSCRSPA
eukprot:12892222-Prorocentrum_lima.AAC.1